MDQTQALMLGFILGAMSVLVLWVRVEKTRRRAKVIPIQPYIVKKDAANE